jgi:RinA family phage transcriptional activator
MPTKNTIRKATFKHIESELYSYQDTKKEMDRLRQQILYGSNNPDENDCSGKNSVRSIGRPTERIATRLVMDKQLRNHEEMIEAIDYVYDVSSEDHKKVIQTKYWSRKPLNWDDVATQLNMHRNTALKYRKEIVLAIASKVGWK